MQNYMTTEELEKFSLQRLREIEAIKDPNVILDLWDDTIGRLKEIDRKLDFLIKVASERDQNIP